MRVPTRRNFLQQCSAAAPAVLVPYWFTSSRSRAAGPNGKLNVASIGVGGRGRGIGHKAGKLGNVIACADVNRQHAEKFAAKYGGKCQIYSDYRDILARGDVDVITCGTPDHWHTKIAIDAMRAGIDVYCEKPLTLTLAESQHITRVAEETGRVLQVGTQQRSEYSQFFIKAIAIAVSIGSRGLRVRHGDSGGPPLRFLRPTVCELGRSGVCDPRDVLVDQLHPDMTLEVRKYVHLNGLHVVDVIARAAWCVDHH